MGKYNKIVVVIGLLITGILFQNCSQGFRAGEGGGSGGLPNNLPSDTNPEDLPYIPPEALKLIGRMPAADYMFPLESPNPSAIDVVEAFPSLTFNSMTMLTHIPDGSNRMVAVQQNGQIRVFPNSPTATAHTLFLDVSGRINSADGEMGLFSIAFDPDYATSGLMWVSYTAGPPLRSVVARYKISANPNLVDPASFKEILTVNQPFTNHNGGMMNFGPDKMLYVALGDGGSGGDPDGNGQKRSVILGKMLRLDVRTAETYAIPADNPFVGQAGIRGEIFAYGLRNTWKFSFDRATGLLWAGDVGQDAWEEISIVNKGENMGWDFCEGKHAFGGGSCAGTKLPLVEYDHTQGQSVTGGYVYRGSQVNSLRGLYVYGDFVSKKMWAMKFNEQIFVSNSEIGTAVQNLSCFGEDEAGEIYLCGYAGPASKVYKFKDKAGVPTPAIPFPAKLSATKLFSNTTTLTPHLSLVPYDVNSPLWSDGSVKRRWFSLPPGAEKIKFNNGGVYEFPIGSIFVKHFEIAISATATKRLETRVMLRQKDGWFGYTYKWNDAGTDADLLAGGLTESVAVFNPTTGATANQNWYYPSRSDCMRCHTTISGYALGFTTAQLNRNFNYSPGGTRNQLATAAEVGLFETAIIAPASYPALSRIGSSTASVADQSRSYLASNCAMCHQPNGPTPMNMDLRYSTAMTAAQLVNVSATNNLGIVGILRLKPGAHADSMLYSRMSRTDQHRMPQVGSNVPDAAALEVIKQWINTTAF